MRHFIFILIFLFPVSLIADDEFVLMGKIISIDKETSAVIVSVNQNCCASQNLSKNLRLNNNNEKEHVVSIFVKDKSIIDNLEVNEFFRFWVKHSDENNTLIATTVTMPGRCLGGCDKTGIRKRLEKSGSSGGRGMGMGRQHGR